MSLKALRKVAQLTQLELADRSNLDNSTISKLESGKSSLRLADYETVARIAQALHLEPMELLQLSEAPPLRFGSPEPEPDAKSA